MYPKTDCQTIANEYNDQVVNRLGAALLANARQGIIGCAFFYGPTIDAAHKAKIGTLLTQSGWTIVDDAPNFTVTLS